MKPNLNLQQKSLLEASGELSPSARQKLLQQVQNDPSASADYRAAHRNFAIFDFLPIPEPSAAQRQYIPRMLKNAIHTALAQHEKQAFRTRLLIRCAAGAMALAACVAICAALVKVNHGQILRQQEQIAQINAMIDRVTLLSGPSASATSYEQAVTDVEASIRQLQTESPTLSYLHDKGMGNLFNALAAVPEEGAESTPIDPSAPPGSF